MRKLCICFFLFLMLLCCGISEAEMKNQTLSLPNHEDEIISVVAIEETLYLSGRNGLYCINMDEASPVCIDGITGIGDGDLNRGYQVNAIEYLFSMQGRLYGLSTAYGIVYEIIIENGVGRTEELIRLDWNGMVGQTDNYAYALTWESMYYLNDHLYILGYDLNDDFDYLHPMLRVFNLKNGEQRKTEVPNAQHILGQKNDELVLMMYDREAEINAWEEEQFCPAIYLWDPGTEKMIYLFDMNTRDAYGILYHEDTNAVYYIDNGKLYMCSADEKMKQVAYVSMSYVSGLNACWLGNKYVCTSTDMVDIRSTNPNDMPSSSLMLYNSTLDSPENIAFIKQHSDIPLEVSTEYYDDSISLAQALISGISKADVFFINAKDLNFTSVIKKGYCLDLTQHMRLTEAVTQMYDFAQQAVMMDDHIYALPVSVTGQGWGIVSGSWQKVAAKEPHTLTALCDFINNWAHQYAEEYTNYVVIEDVENYKRELTKVAFEMYADYYAASDMPLTLDSDLFRKTMKTVSQITDELDVMISSEDDRFELWEKTALFCRRDDILTPGKRDFIPFECALEEGLPFIINADIVVAFINPRSQNIEAAIQYLISYVDNMDAIEKIKLYPDYHTPIEDASYVKQVEEWENEIKVIETALVEAEDGSKAKLEDRLATLHMLLEDKEERRYMVSEDMIRNYHELATHVIFSNQSILYGNGDNAEGVFSNLLNRYIEGQIDLERFIKEGDEKLRMIQNE